MSLAYYNKLPTRPEYISKVLSALKEERGYQLMEITRASRLTRTQVLCALSELVASDVVSIVRESGVVRYLRKSSSIES